MDKKREIKQHKQEAYSVLEKKQKRDATLDYKKIILKSLKNLLKKTKNILRILIQNYLRK